MNDEKDASDLWLKSLFTGEKKFGQIMVISIIFLLGILLLTFTRKELTLKPFEKTQLVNTSAISSDDLGNYYIISSSNRLISKIEGRSQLAYSIEGGSRAPDAYYIADDVTVNANGDIAVLSEVWDETGSYIEIERIQLYDQNGKFIRTIFELLNEAGDKLIPAIKGMKFDEGKLHWFVLEANDLQYYNEDHVDQVYTYAYANAKFMIQDAELLSSTTMAVATKNGQLLEINIETDEVVILYDTNALEHAGSTIWGIQTLEPGRVYFNDIGKFGIYQLGEGKSQLVLRDPNQGDGEKEVFYFFTVRDVGKHIEVAAVNDNRVMFMDSSGIVTQLGPLSPSTETYIKRLLAIMSLIFIGLGLVLGIRWIFKYFFKGKLPTEFGITVPILLVVAVSSVLVSSVAIQAYDRVINQQAFNTLKMVVQNSKFAIDGDAVDAIQKSSDYMNGDYLKVYEDLQALINYNQESWNENLYTALYKVVDGRYYTLMYNDNRVMPYYPFNAWTSDIEYDYFKRAYEGQITEGTEDDADGQWLFSMGPVYDQEGNIVAIIEVGMNRFIFDQWNEAIVKRIIIDILSIIIILVLLVSEAGFLSSWISERMTASEHFNRLKIIRPLGMLSYMVIFMCTAFIPTMAKSIYAPIGNLSMPMALGLPIFMEVLFAAVTIVFAGFLAERRGWRLIFQLGIVILIITAIATALTQSLIVFICIRGLAGIGNGFIQMTMHAFVNTGETVAIRNEAFAHMMSGAIAGTNLGIVLGANLADKIGYFNVFYVMAGIGILAFVFERTMMRRYETMAYEIKEEEDEEEIITGTELEAEIHEEEVHGSMNWWQYFTRKNVVVFFSLILVPAFLCYMYLEYYFPIFAEKNGLSTSIVGIVFSLYGLFIVYLGPTMSTVTEKYLGVRMASVLASVLTGVSLLVFAFSGTLVGAIVAVLVLALSDSFGETVYTTYFLALKESQRIGKSIAAGYLEFFSQIGKMLGALAFGVAIGFGDQLGIGVIGIITLAMGLAFMPLGGRVK